MANEVANLIFKADTSDIEKAVKRLGYLSKSANDAEKEVGDLAKMADKADDKVDKLGKKSKKAGKSVQGLTRAAGGAKGKLLGMAAALVSVGTAVAFANKFNEVNRQFAIMQGQLVTATGSAAAAADEFERLKEFAATTPFDLAQSVDGFVKLKNLGLDPSQDSMRSFGNTAAAMGKNLNQMIEAVADASTGEFERLKEFGIKSKTEGDKVSFVFQGVTTTVGKNAEEITGYLASIGNEKFGDAMSNQAASFAGATSNLQDSFDNIFREAGDGGALESMTDSFRELSESLGTQEAQDGAKAIADMMAAIVKGASTSLSGLLDFVGRLDNMAGLKIGADGISIIDPNSAEGFVTLGNNVTMLEDKLAGQKATLQKYFNIWSSSTNLMDSTGAQIVDFLKPLSSLKNDAEEAKEAIDKMNIKIAETATRLEAAKQSLADVSLSSEVVSGSFSPAMDIFTGETPQMSGLAGTEDKTFSDVEFKSDVEAEAKQAEIDRVKALELEFQTWKDDLVLTDLEKLQEAHLLKLEKAKEAAEAKQAEVDSEKNMLIDFAEWKQDKEVTELDLMKEGYLLQEEAYQAHKDEMYRIDEVNRTVKKELDDTSFLSAAAGNKSHDKFMEKAKKGEIKLEELTGKQKLKIGVGVASDILGHAAKNSETAFKMQKGLKMAEAVQNTYSAAMGAYSALAPIPYVGPALGIAAAAAATMSGAANVKAIAATKFNKGGGGASVAAPAMGGGGGGGGGGISAASVAEIAPMQEAANDEPAVAAPSVVNVTVDGTIDPTGARRIIEAINEATEDGLEINALVGT